MRFRIGLVRRGLALPPGELIRRALRLTVRVAHDLRQRVRDALGGEGISIPGALVEQALYGPEAVLPVAWTEEGELSPERDTLLDAARHVLAHRFDLLGSGHVTVDYSLRAAGLHGHRYNGSPGQDAAEAQRHRMEHLLGTSIEGYDPIDWHIDFKSGYRWDPDQWFSAVAWGHLPGVDVKVPWELSRFQHLGVLGLAHRLMPDSPEGEAASVELRLQLVDWLTANPVRRGVNWAMPMDVALRGINWLMAMELFRSVVEPDQELRTLLTAALVRHGRHIETNLEYHPERSGNHYVSNALGLLALGAALPGLAEADRWVVFALQELESQMENQVHPDGVDVEGSTAYHGFVGEMFAVAAAIVLRIPESRRVRLRDVQPGPVAQPVAPSINPWPEQRFDLTKPWIFSGRFLRRLRAMATYTAGITKQDGLIPQIGDIDNGRVLQLGPAPDPRDWRALPAAVGRMLGDPELEAVGAPYGDYAKLLVPNRGSWAGAIESASQPLAVREAGPSGESVEFSAGGVAVGRAGGLYVAVHLGLLSPSSPQAHFHNDLLSFELQWQGVDIVVDPGCFVYTPLPEVRNAYRATAAHNTVEVEGREQRLWPGSPAGLFAIDRDADLVRIKDLRPNGLRALCAYGPVRHERAWSWTPNRLEVRDTVVAPHPATATLNLAPGVQPEAEARPQEGVWLLKLRSDAGTIRLRWEGVARPAVQPGLFSVGYGREMECSRIRAVMTGTDARFALELGP